MDNKLSIHPGPATPLFIFSGPIENIADSADRDKTQSRGLHQPASIGILFYSRNNMH